MKEEDMKLEINSKEEKAREIENEIKVLNESLEEINYTKLIKEPASSVSPIAPRKKLIVLIAGVLGLIMFTFLSFFLEYVEKQKDKRRI